MQHWPWLRSLQSELDDSLASQVTVPLLASNNLYPQLTKSSQDMIHSNVEDHCMDKPCMLDLNQAQKGKEKTQAYQCPLRGHLLVWGVDSSLTFQIHEEKIASLLEVTVPLNISTSGVHFPKLFAKNLFDTDLSTAAGNKAAGSLIAGESMFIPNNYLVSFRVSDETPRTRAMMLCVVDASNLNAFRQELHSHAYVSAEHAYILNDVTRLMSIARVATSTAAGEAAALMNKQPKDCLPLADYQAGKGNKGSNGEEAAAEAVPVNTRNRKNKGKQKNFKVWQDSIQWKTLLDSLMIPAASTPHIAKMSRNTITLTWKQAFVPVDSDQTAFGFRLQLCALPKVTVDDSSGTPQQIMHAHHIVGKSEAEGKFVLQVNSENSVHQCVDREYLRSNEGFVESASLQDVAQGVVNFDLVLDNLLPDTFYQVRASIVYGSKLGPMSEWSEVLFTRPITPPSTPQPPKNLLRTEDDDGLILQVTNDHQLFAEAHPSLVQISFAAKIHFSPSTDDGGDALIGYMVYSRIVNRGHFYNEWVKHGIYSAQRTPEGNAFVLVHNLIPQLSYAFKVSAVNSLGESKPSNVSNTVRIESFAILANHSQPFGRYGVGFQSAYGEETSRFLNSAEESARIASGLSIDHDMTGVVEVNLIDEFISAWKLQDQTPLAEISLPLWRCHWSYPMQSVIGVMKEVTDFNDHHDEGEDNQLSKSTEFVGKIAVVHRGTLPLYQLALHAQVRMIWSKYLSLHV